MALAAKVPLIIFLKTDLKKSTVCRVVLRLGGVSILPFLVNNPSSNLKEVL